MNTLDFLVCFLKNGKTPWCFKTPVQKGVSLRWRSCKLNSEDDYFGKNTMYLVFLQYLSPKPHIISKNVLSLWGFFGRRLLWSSTAAEGVGVRGSPVWGLLSSCELAFPGWVWLAAHPWPASAPSHPSWSPFSSWSPWQQWWGWSGSHCWNAA